MRHSLWKSQWKTRITRRSRMQSTATMTIALVLLLLGCQACVSVPPRTANPIEGWKIDPADASLYRKVPGEKEDYIIITDNPEVREFMCFEKQALKELILRSDK